MHAQRIPSIYCIQRKVVARDDAVMASTGLPPDLKARDLEV
jgi:hypothetical protein